MKIRDILTNNYLKNERLKQKKIREGTSDGTKSAKSTDATGKTDQTQISAEARELQQSATLIQNSVEILKSMPAIREDAVLLARERVNSGYYDQPEVLDAVAGIIGQHLSANSPLSASDLATDIIANISPQNSDLTKSDLMTIRKNLEAGLYQSSEVVNTVADKIYQFLNSVNSSE